MRINSVLFFLLLIVSTQAFAQQKALVFGNVKDEEGKNFSLVTVSVKGTTIATKTDEQGYYELRVPADSNIVINYAYIGYQSETISIRLKANERFRADKRFVKKSIDVSEVIVQSDEERTSTITKIDPKLLSSFTLRHAQGGALILLAVSTLFRFDMAVPFIVVLGVMYFVQPQYRKQNLTWGLGLLVLFLGGQTLARYFYYGDWLPNTYYLKVTGWPFILRLLRGLYALVWFIYYTNWALFLIPFTLLIFRRGWKINLLFLILLTQMAYSVYVGGDAWEEHGGANRYIAIAMPLFFAVFAVSVEELRRKAVASFDTVSERRTVRTGAGRIADVGSQTAWLVIFVISILNFNLLMGDWKYIERWQFTRKPDYVAGSEHNLGIALALQNATKPGASIAVIGAGTIPYLLPDRFAIDILGKADPVIAREAVRTPMSYEDIPDMRPGHMKWDYARTFGELQPDVIVSIWEGTDEEAAPYLKNYVYAVIGEGVKVYLKKDSPNVWWDKVIIKN